MSAPVSLLWLRNDLRLDDQPALHAAMAKGHAVVPVFIWDSKAEGDWPLGGAARVWLHGSLQKLGTELRGAGSRLIVRQGNTADELGQTRQGSRQHGCCWTAVATSRQPRFARKRSKRLFDYAT